VNGEQREKQRAILRMRQAIARINQKGNRSGDSGCGSGLDVESGNNLRVRFTCAKEGGDAHAFGN